MTLLRREASGHTITCDAVEPLDSCHTLALDFQSSKLGGLQGVLAS